MTHWHVLSERGVFSDQSKSIGCSKSSSSSHWRSSKTKFDVQDWSHANSIFSSPTGDLIVSVRNLDAVVAFARDGTGRRWVLSGNENVSSDFSFAPHAG